MTDMGGGHSGAGLVSPDGKWVWDGAAWQAKDAAPQPTAGQLPRHVSRAAALAVQPPEQPAAFFAALDAKLEVQTKAAKSVTMKASFGVIGLGILIWVLGDDSDSSAVAAILLWCAAVVGLLVAASMNGSDASASSSALPAGWVRYVAHGGTWQPPIAATSRTLLSLAPGGLLFWSPSGGASLPISEITCVTLSRRSSGRPGTLQIVTWTRIVSTRGETFLVLDEHPDGAEIRFSAVRQALGDQAVVREAVQ